MVKDMTEQEIPVNTPINLMICLKIANNDKSIVKKLLAMFISELPTAKTSINEAFEKYDTNAMGALTHKLLGSSAYCGAQQLQRSLNNISKHIKENNKEAISNELGNMNNCITEIMDYYRENIINTNELEATCSST